MATAAAAATSSPVFINSHTKTRFQSKPISLISFPSSNFLQKNTNLKLQRTPLISTRLELRKQLKVGAKEESLSSEEEIQSLVFDGGDAVVNQDEVFSRTSVILPFLFPALGGLLFGYDIGAISGAAISLQSPNLSGTTWFNLSSIQLGLVVSGSLYGAFIGSILIHPIADFLGRRRELIIAAMLYMLGGLTTGFAPTLNVLILGRFLYGLGIGLAMHGAPQYIAETCPSQIRAKLVFMKELMIVFGILLGYLAKSIVIDAFGGWRYMFGFSAPAAVLMGLGMWSLPESPRWLLRRAVQGKTSLVEYKERAIAGLSRLRGRPAGDKVSEKQIEETLVSLKETHADQESEGSFWEVFRGLSLKAITVGVGLVLFLQITGHPSVLYYAGSISQTAGFAAVSVAARVAAVIGLIKFLIFLGRRPLLIEGVSGITTVSLVFLSAYYKILQGHPPVAVGALLLYVGCYQISFAPISWLMVSEIFPIRTRERGISQYSLSVLKNFGANVLVYFAPSSLKEQIASQLVNILLFVGIALASVLFIVFIVPESKG
ncbi:hypothetical protein MKW98_019744 [Papaver atlanticum]|uniref:Major facilitator superfamily (MFS) profile domain-containing protein n=1 Tax=Papaver atlanticum TaxID=357466 RepID=A0AAD4XTK6_9MAGN|nr:hypothetical protein MKW98_019744 [Papaver atlanticum]